jgi:antitoxin ParD1/3/4
MAREASLKVSVPPELEEFVFSRVSSGRYASASEVVAEGLRILEEQEAEHRHTLDGVRSLIASGLEQARRGELLDGDEVFRDLEERIRSSE